MSNWRFGIVGLLILVKSAPSAWAETESTPPRHVTLDIDLAHRLEPLQIDKVASLGQGGQAPDPIWAGRAAEVRALHPRLIRVFLQEYFDVLPAKGVYRFDAMDKVVDLVRESGAEPMMNVCFKPKVLFPRIDPATVEPNDWDEWGRLMAALVRHYKDRGTKIRYWEIMNEPDIGEMGGCPYQFSAANYPPFYQRTAAAILAADPDARVGGPAVANPDSPIFAALLDHCAAHNVPLHFISWHIYSSSPSAVRRTIEGKQAQLANHPNLKGVETFLDEWNVNLLQPLRDPRFQPCYVAEAVYQMIESRLDYGCYFHIRDYQAEQEMFDRFMTPAGSAFMAKWWDRNHQNSGLFDFENNVRPAYFAFKLLARLTGRRLKVESSDQAVHALATYDQRADIYNLMIWNFSDRTARAELHLSGLGDGWNAKRIVLDSTTPSPDENSRLHTLEPLPLRGKDAASPTIDLEPYGICFWMIER